MNWRSSGKKAEKKILRIVEAEIEIATVVTGIGRRVNLHLISGLLRIKRPTMGGFNKVAVAVIDTTRGRKAGTIHVDTEEEEAAEIALVVAVMEAEVEAEVEVEVVEIAPVAAIVEEEDEIVQGRGDTDSVTRCSD
mmetsp:Transcript_8413/g.12744  ORF Transcript_8413/g.12744 Transcript_8413/m.12744 type:complete len:136 (-) Transcript_8413:24-431(-)